MNNRKKSAWANKQSKISSASEYSAFVSNHNPPLSPINPDVREFLANSVNESDSIGNGNGALKLFVNQLTTEEKIDFVRALIMNDVDKISEVLTVPLSHIMHVIGIDNLRNIAVHTEAEKAMQPSPWFNSLVINLIRETLINESGERLSENEKHVILAGVMKTIPDTLIDVSAKVGMIKAIDGTLKPFRVAYAEAVKPVIDTEHEKNPNRGNITLDEYRTAVKSKQIDHSQYILLTLGLLEKSGGSSTTVLDYIDVIRAHYVNRDYDSAIRVINNCIHSGNNLIGPETSEEIGQAQKFLKPVVRAKNYSRRFLENRLAATMQKSFTDYDAVNKIASHFLPDRKAENPGQLLTLLSDLNDMSNPELLSRMNELKASSTLWRERGRGGHKRDVKKNLDTGVDERTKIQSKIKEASGHPSTDAIYTRNLGVMTSSQPNYADELSTHPLRNTSVDINTANEDELKNNPYAVFVAGASGHAYFMVAVLEKYMNDNRISPTLKEDVNTFISIYAASYVSQGYHGLMEMLDVFAEPVVTSIFEDRSLILDVDIPYHILDRAFHDTQEYIKNLSLKQALNQEFVQRNSLYEAILSNDVNHVTAVLKKGVKANELVIHENYSGSSLSLALTHNANVDIINLLLKNGAVITPEDLNIAVDNKNTQAVLLFDQHGYKFTENDVNKAVNADFVEAVKFLVEQKGYRLTDTNGAIQQRYLDAHASQAMYDYFSTQGNVIDENSGTILHHIIASRRTDETKIRDIATILSTQPHLLHQTNAMGQTPLLAALSAKNEKLLNELINHEHMNKDALNITDLTGQTPLMIAIENGFGLSTIRAFIENGSDVAATNVEGQNIVHSLVSHQSKDIINYIVEHVNKRNPKLLTLADIYGETPLSVAEAKHNDNVVEAITNALKRNLVNAPVATSSSGLFAQNKDVNKNILFAKAMSKASRELDVDLAHLEDRPGVKDAISDLQNLLIDLGNGKKPEHWQDTVKSKVNSIQAIWATAEEDKHDELDKVLKTILKEVDKLNPAEQKTVSFNPTPK